MSLLPALRYSLLALAIIAPVTILATAPDQSVQTIEKLVDVGGYNLNFRIIPGQGPAILLEAGGGMDSTEWGALAPRLAQETGATVLAEKSGPMVPYSQPDLLVSVVSEVMRLAR